MWQKRDEQLTAALPADVQALGWYAVGDGVLRNPAQSWVIVCWPGDMDKACDSARTISSEAERLKEARAREVAEKAGKVRPKKGRPAVRQMELEL
jgi:hypothetical protein